MANARKLRLEIDQLQVESFDTRGVMEGRGTVRGHDPVDSLTVAGGGGGLGCQCQTHANTCIGSCQPSCEASCPYRPGCEDNETMYQTCFETCAWEGGQAVVCSS